MSKTRLLKRLTMFVFGLIICGLLGCNSNKMTSFTGGISNNTGHTIEEAYINGAWVSNMDPYSQGSGICCVVLPAKWHEGMTVKVEWTNARDWGPSDLTHTYLWGETVWKTVDAKVLPYPSYGRNNVYVHIFPDDTAVVEVTAGIGTSQIPSPVKPPNFVEEPYVVRYCNSVKLTTMTQEECLKRGTLKYESINQFNQRLTSMPDVRDAFIKRFELFPENQMDPREFYPHFDVSRVTCDYQSGQCSIIHKKKGK